MLTFFPQANVVCVVFDVMVEETLERVMTVELLTFDFVLWQHLDIMQIGT